jgi:hypothetical protein
MDQTIDQRKEPLPNSVASLVLGICSLVFSCFFVGLVLGIIGIVMAKKGKAIYQSDPNKYSGYGQLNAGYIMSIIGVVLSGLTILYYIIAVAILGAASLFSF